MNVDLTVSFQPIFLLGKRRRQVGAEYLVRGKGGFSNPLTLFNWAKSFGKLKQADINCCFTCAEAASRYNGMVFINIFSCTLAELLEHAKDIFIFVPPERLVFEISEQDALRNLDMIHRAVAAWKAMGVRFAIDDIASGYDRIAALVELEPAFIKLDGALTRNCHINQTRQIVIKHLVKMARELHVDIIAEMIETIDEYDALKKLGVKYGQGFLLCKPKQAE
ncbi:MAG: EAL domain-containing protein [Syntrophothermus sp.]|uniref:EAL domain-containing protein n=1 Tax=Syntrophothermus sp. TaxID=2736299 RepID=UPI00257EA72C|nr:EAL domain-containing protein [Syntrophothermus sp.]NSW83621.1 EAL domain-containing protein [Syntrophothermus sp.]